MWTYTFDDLFLQLALNMGEVGKYVAENYDWDAELKRKQEIKSPSFHFFVSDFVKDV